jgi:hypothetical protein
LAPRRRRSPQASLLYSAFMSSAAAVLDTDDAGREQQLLGGDAARLGRAGWIAALKRFPGEEAR